MIDICTPENMINTLLTEINSLKEELCNLRAGLEKMKIQVAPNHIYNNKEIRQILGVDERLIRKYRDNGLLTYHRQNDKYWYRGVDILDFLSRSRYQAFA